EETADGFSGPVRDALDGAGEELAGSPLQAEVEVTDEEGPRGRPPRLFQPEALDLPAGQAHVAVPDAPIRRVPAPRRDGLDRCRHEDFPRPLQRVESIGLPRLPPPRGGHEAAA